MTDNVSFDFLLFWSRSCVLWNFHHINNTTTTLYNNVDLITHLSWIIRIAIEYVYKRQNICFTSLSERGIGPCFINLHYANFICHWLSGHFGNLHYSHSVFEEGMWRAFNLHPPDFVLMKCQIMHTVKYCLWQLVSLRQLQWRFWHKAVA